jgi:hypothetical protein
MKNPVSKLIALLASCLSIFLVFSERSFGLEVSERMGIPFYLPQTSFIVGNVDYSLELSNSNRTSNFSLSENGINTYGFDLEVNANRFLNIGAYLHVESLSVQQNQDISKQFSTLLGGFTRFFYIPPFLRGKDFTANVFTRLELGGGPVFLNGPSGLIGQGGIHFGVETYFNRWFGLSFSYGRVYEYGKETLLSGDKDLAEQTSKYSNSTIWNQGEVFTFAFKTTFF